MAVRVVIAVLAVAVVAPLASAQGTSPRATILQQSAALKQARWRAMYATYTAAYRRACPYSRFVTNQRRLRGLLGTNFQLRGIQVRNETRTRALVAYRFVQNGRTIAAVTFRNRDVYRKVGSRWYDELDRVSGC